MHGWIDGGKARGGGLDGWVDGWEGGREGWMYGCEGGICLFKSWTLVRLRGSGG